MADNEELEVTESPELADEQEATDAEVVFVEPREVIEKGECEPCPSMAPAWMATFADMATLLTLWTTTTARAPWLPIWRRSWKSWS